MGGKRTATTWAEIEALPAATRESFLAGFIPWVNDRFAVDLAQYWPMTERGVRGTRSPHSFAQRSRSGWPECWFDHGWVRDCVLNAYVWDQEIAASNDGTAGAARAAYQEHVRNTVVPEVQAIAHMCELGHVDPAARPIRADPWQPASPPLPDEPASVVVPEPGGGTESPQDDTPVPGQDVQMRPRAGQPMHPGPWDGLIGRPRPPRDTTPERDPVDR